jgi:uncharacterized protein YuzE
MKIRYFRDTDTLYLELSQAMVTETPDVDENTFIDLDSQGNICAVTLEHAFERFV